MFILAMIWLQGYLEDKIMEKKFGAKFAAYRRETGMFWIK
jgi:protein-S-isoprenylcysteine O-methyltransferase Ste14